MVPFTSIPSRPMQVSLAQVVQTIQLRGRGGGAFSIGPFTTIGGSLEILNVPESTASNEVCSTNVKGNLELKDVGTGVEIGSSTPTPCGANAVGGNLHAQSKSTATALAETCTLIPTR